MRGRARSAVVLAAAAGVVVAAALVARGGDDEPSTRADRVHAIAAELRCPVCQNLSVADSPSPLAGEMRTEIAAQLAAGRTPEQIRAFFVARYGGWILLAPTRRGLGMLPWLVPVVGLLAGAAVWVAIVRRRAVAAGGVATTADRRRIQRELAELGEEPE